MTVTITTARLVRDLARQRAEIERRVAERADLPDLADGRAVVSWLMRLVHREMPDAEKVRMRIATAQVLESTSDPLHHKEASDRLAYLLGDTPEPRRYAGPGDVILTADEATALVALLNRAGDAVLMGDCNAQAPSGNVRRAFDGGQIRSRRTEAATDARGSAAAF